MKLLSEIIDNLDKNREPIYRPKLDNVDFIILKENGEDAKEEDCYNEKIFARGEHRGYTFTVWQKGSYANARRIPQYISIGFPEDQYSWAHKRLAQEEEDLVNGFLRNVLKPAVDSSLLQSVYVSIEHIRFIDNCPCGYPTTQELIQKAEKIINILADHWETMYADAK